MKYLHSMIQDLKQQVKKNWISCYFMIFVLSTLRVELFLSPLFPQLGESEHSRAQLRHTLEEVESSRQDEHHSEALEAALQERVGEITALRASEKQKVC